MKNIIKNITLCGLMAVGAGMTLASCDDFLTITPTNKIVEEDYWKDKNDLNSSVMACYKRLVGNDILAKYIYWGEERSDNFERSSGVSASGPVANIMNANLLPTYDQFSWTAMYNAINYCNKVLAHGPEIIERDESFSNNNWKPIKAEMVTLRALCHFYLVRTFGEIPYITEDYNNDSQELRTAQSTQLTVLNNIIEDLESIKDDAVVDYGNTVENKGRITKKAVYALLADVYLWRASYKAGNNQPFTKVTVTKSYNGPLTEEELASRVEDYGTTADEDYQQCIDYCDLVIDMAFKEKRDYIQKYSTNVGGTLTELDLEDLLAQNETTLDSYSSSPYYAHRQIFGIGNSDESIFELQVEGTDYTNNMVADLFISLKGEIGQFKGVDAAFSGADETPNTTTPNSVFTRTDYRRWETILFAEPTQNTFPIGKFILSDVSQTNPESRLYLTDNTKDNLTTLNIASTRRSILNTNWIIYRLSEVYLMKAEAMSQLYEDEENLSKAFQYVRAVYKRSNPYAYQASNGNAKIDSLNFKNNFTTSASMESLVLAERRREFVGEGKRWFDLVRYALRRGNTKDMLEILSKKYTNSKAIQAKLADMQSLFSPVYNNEIKNNTWLYQNGVWAVNETSSRTDDL
ncbi:MAG: RagB/SusD family nutrient uptake outer membrane protein [Bacteroidaceae bacterium]|nr:RagB/SusD family nutrient uptake outer membrane protein [Bacteroidaceae bacterium]